MPDPMTGFYEGPPRAERVEVITSVQRRRRWSTEEKVRIAASELRAAHHQIRELQRLLGKKTLENEILREAVERVTAPKKLPSRVTSWPGGGR